MRNEFFLAKVSEVQRQQIDATAVDAPAYAEALDNEAAAGGGGAHGIFSGGGGHAQTPSSIFRPS